MSGPEGPPDRHASHAASQGRAPGRAAELAARRAALVQQAQAQRGRLAHSVGRLRGELAPERLLQRLIGRGLAALGLAPLATGDGAGAGEGNGGHAARHAGLLRWAGMATLAWRWWRRWRRR